MIINALYNYYQRLLEDEKSGVSRPGWSKARVAFALVLSNEGELVDVLDLRDQRGNRLVPRQMDVPEQHKRTVGIASNFLCDNAMYVLGLKPKGRSVKAERPREAHRDFVHLHNSLLGSLDDPGAKAVLKFLNKYKWDPSDVESHPKVMELNELTEEGNLVFRLAGDSRFVHQRQEIVRIWEDYRSSESSELRGQCLVTGRELPIAALHPGVQGVKGAQSTGASLVSFNLDAFRSYGKKQGYNAPVGEDVAFAYTTALEYLLKNDRHRILIGDTTTVFWAERSHTGMEESLLAALLNPSASEERVESGNRTDATHVTRDPKMTRLLHDVLSRIKTGKHVTDGLTDIDPGVMFYILGLAPNSSRLSVRFWHVSDYGSLLEKLSAHHRDLALEKSYPSDPDFIPIRSILKELAPLGDMQRLPPLLGGALMRSVLTGLPYPQVIYSGTLSRIRADKRVGYVRAAVIKASLVRRRRFQKTGIGVNITVSLDEQSTNTAYRLGRLFALIEKAQEDVNPSLNSTVKDKYFGAASATPGSIFPVLLRLTQHHIAKSDYGSLMDRRIQEVLSEVHEFPRYLSLEEQGLFVLGYYHQRQALFTKNERKEG